MIIKVTGYKNVEYTNKNNQQVKGLDIHGLVSQPDFDDKNVEGKLSFSSFFSLQNLEGNVPIIGDEYEVVFAITEFAGEYRARPHHLKEV